MTVDEAKYIESNNNRVAKDTITLLDHQKTQGILMVFIQAMVSMWYF